MSKKHLVTTNFYTAIFLFAKGIYLLNIDKTNPKRCKFVFEKTPESEMLLEVFSYAKNNDPEVMIDARKMVVATRQIKEKLYQDNF